LLPLQGSKRNTQYFSYRVFRFFMSHPCIIATPYFPEVSVKILTNEKTIRRNAKIGQYSSIIALVVLAGGMYISFSRPELFSISAASLLIGFILSQVGIYFGNRWGRHPRMDERLTAALKGLTKDYTLYHFITPVNHLLVGPAGIWIIEPYYQRGKIVYEGNKWKQKGGGLLLGYLKIFAQEGLGRPDLEVQADIDSLASALKKALGEDIPPVNAVLVFTDERAELAVENARLPTMKIRQAKPLPDGRDEKNTGSTARRKRGIGNQAYFKSPRPLSPRRFA
jgi:hypothetical protein